MRRLCRRCSTMASRWSDKILAFCARVTSMTMSQPRVKFQISRASSVFWSIAKTLMLSRCLVLSRWLLTLMPWCQAPRCLSTQIRSPSLKPSCSARSKLKSDSWMESLWVRNKDRRRSTFSAQVISTFKSTTSPQTMVTKSSSSTRWRDRTPTAMTTVWHCLYRAKWKRTSRPTSCWRMHTLVSSELCLWHSSMILKLQRSFNRAHRSSKLRRLPS